MGLALIIPNADYSAKNLGQVTLLQDVPITGISIVANSSYSAMTFTPTISYTPTNTNQKGVTWSVISGNSYASINATTGVVTILSGASSNLITIEAVSTYDGSITNTANVAVTYKDTVDSLTAITINGSSSVGENGATYTVTYTPTNTSYPGVTWSITSGSAYASISSTTGVLTAIGNGSVTIQATSTHDSSIVATKTVTVAATATDDTVISFADAAVKALCVANFDTNSDGEITVGEAKLVGVGTGGSTYFLPGIFHGNTTITSFDELKYFTRLTNMQDGYDFNGCINLASIKIPSSMVSLDYTVFKNCSKLPHIDIPAGVTKIGNGAFMECTSLQYAIIRSTTLPDLGSDIFLGSTCPIYVVDSLYDAYKANSNFSQYSTRIAKLSTFVG